MSAVRYVVTVETADEHEAFALDYVASKFDLGALARVVAELVDHLTGRHVALSIKAARPSRDELLAMVYELDVAAGYRVPFDTDHVHKVERDATPVVVPATMLTPEVTR